jgi:hypothetical protein
MNRIFKTGCYLALIILVSGCSSKRITPFLTSLVLNRNVYKTKDTLELTRVYDYSAKRPVHDTITYNLLPDPGQFLRYTVMKEGDKPIVYVLKGTRFEHSPTNAISPVYIKYAYSTQAEANGYYYQFKSKSADMLPSKQYLATEHIAALPITIPIKYRINAPANKVPFSLNASISYAFGYRIRINNNPFNDNYIRVLPILVGFSTDTYLAKDSINVKGYTGETSIALNLASGLTYEAGNRFNFGVFIGFDKMFSNQKDWIYQNKAWLGIGFGYKFGSDK